MDRPNGTRLKAARRAINWQTFAGVALLFAGALLPQHGSLNVEGASAILVAAYGVVAVTAVARVGLHLWARYPQAGLGRWVLKEAAVAILWLAMAIVLALGEEPQFPELGAFGAAAALFFFFASTDLEEARERRLFEGLGGDGPAEIRRATDVLRESSIWLAVCKRFRKLDFRIARALRHALSKPDRPVGSLSWGASIILVTPAAIAATALCLGLLSVVSFGEATREVSDGDGGPLGEQPGGSVHGRRLRPDVAVEGGEVGGGDNPGESELREDSRGDCSTAYDPGPRVPDPARDALALAWHGVDGLEPGPLEALGFDIGGCPGKPRPIPGLEGGWFVPGYCGEGLQALAIALPGLEHPVTLLEQAAEFALPIVLRGQFVEAVDRFSVGEGDAYIVQTRRGPYVLIRDRATAGPLDEEERAGCGGHVDEDVAYSVVGPGLIEAWRSAASLALGGVEPLGSTQGAHGGGSFVFRGSAGIVGQARCRAAGTVCEARYGNGPWQLVAHAGSVAVDEVRALAE